MLLFGTLKFLRTFLGACWRFLAHFDSKMAPEMDPELAPTSGKNRPKICRLFLLLLSNFWANFGRIFGLETQGCKLPRTSWRPGRPAKRLKNVKLSSKSAFSLRELPTFSSNTNTKHVKNIKLSLKSASMTSEHPNPSLKGIQKKHNEHP